MELLALASRPFAPKMLDHLMVAGTAVVVEHPFGEYRKYNLSSIVAYSYQVPGMHVAEDVTAYHSTTDSHMQHNYSVPCL